MDVSDPTSLVFHVLLVDRDSIALVETTNLLKSCSYRVTSVPDASVALSMLLKGKTTFDLIMVDVSSSYLEGYKLLYVAVNMEFTVILMSIDVNPLLAKSAIGDGAFLFLEKPTTKGHLQYIWQYSFSDKLRKYRKECLSREQLIPANNITSEARGESAKRSIIKDDISTRNINGTIGVTSTTVKDGNSTKTNNDNCHNNKRKRSRACTYWTLPLHRRFVAAIKELGEARCYPREIARLMNVPGLTTLKISTHLQRCRLGWQHPDEERDAPPLLIQKPHHMRLGANGLFPDITGNSQSLIPSEVNKPVVYENHDSYMNDSTPMASVLNMGQGIVAPEPLVYNDQKINDLTVPMHGGLKMGQDGVVFENNNLEENSYRNMAANQGLPIPDFSPEFLNEIKTENFDVQHVTRDLQDIMPSQNGKRMRLDVTPTEDKMPALISTNNNEDSEEHWDAWVSSFLNDVE